MNNDTRVWFPPLQFMDWMLARTPLIGSSNSPASSAAILQGGRVDTVHSLRGLAAMAVAFFHFSNGNPSFYVPALLRDIGSFGWLGVEIFFVISGFILPYSLWRAGYRLSPANFGRFVLKRVIRLDPPYFASIALSLVLLYAAARAPGFSGTPFHLDPMQLGLHVGYLNGIAGVPWLNPVYWTLAIEFQFYLLTALILPLLASRSWMTRSVTVGLMLAASLSFPDIRFVGYYFPLFVFGIVAFQLFTGICVRWEAVLVFLCAALVLYPRMGGWVTFVGLATALGIFALPSWTNAPMAFLGTLSYSLYLLHVPVGGRVINLAQRLPASAFVAIVGIGAAFALSIAAAYVLFRVVERPAQQYAGSLRFTGTITPNSRES